MRCFEIKLIYKPTTPMSELYKYSHLHLAFFHHWKEKGVFERIKRRPNESEIISLKEGNLLSEKEITEIMEQDPYVQKKLVGYTIESYNLLEYPVTLVQFEEREMLCGRFLYNLLTRSDYEITATMFNVAARTQNADKNDRKGYYQWWCSVFIGTINALLMNKAYKNQMVITYYGSADYTENLSAHKASLKRKEALRLELLQKFSCLRHQVKQNLLLEIKVKAEILKDLEEIIKAEEAYLFDGKIIENKVLTEKEILELFKMLQVTHEVMKNNKEQRLSLFGEFKRLRAEVNRAANEFGTVQGTIIVELDKIILRESTYLFETPNLESHSFPLDEKKIREDIKLLEQKRHLLEKEICYEEGMIKLHLDAEKRLGDKFNDVKLLQSYGRNDNQLVNRHTDCYMGFSQYVINNYAKLWEKCRQDDYLLNIIDTYNMVSERFRNLQNIISLLEKALLHLETPEMVIENILQLYEMFSSALPVALKKLNEFAQILSKENQNIRLLANKAGVIAEDDCAFNCTTSEESSEILKIHDEIVNSIKKNAIFEEALNKIFKVAKDEKVPLSKLLEVNNLFYVRSHIGDQFLWNVFSGKSIAEQQRLSARRMVRPRQISVERQQEGEIELKERREPTSAGGSLLQSFRNMLSPSPLRSGNTTPAIPASPNVSAKEFKTSKPESVASPPEGALLKPF
jgi:hypothetical protein